MPFLLFITSPLFSPTEMTGFANCRDSTTDLPHGPALLDKLDKISHSEITSSGFFTCPKKIK